MFMGMNRSANYNSRLTRRVPHIDGDEPLSIAYMKALYAEFPMFMGMNRVAPAAIDPDDRVPHVHGDEPQAAIAAAALSESSPCSWG